MKRKKSLDRLRFIGLTRINTDFFVFIKFYFTQHRDIESSHNWAEMRIWVEKNVSYGGRREHREKISYYGIKSKGI